MGAWGIGNFENDDAGDWVYDLEKSKDKSILHKALNSVLENSGYIEAPECCEALAAAEVIYSGLSSDHSGISEEVIKWLVKKPGLFKKPITFEASDAIKAIETINKILHSSELKELWEESDEFEKWNEIENSLIEKLSKHA
jgi:hypothetical protein